MSVKWGLCRVARYSQWRTAHIIVVYVYGSNRGKEAVAVVNVFPGCAYHKPFMVRFLDKSEWQNGFNPGKKKGGGGVADWFGMQVGPRAIKTLVLGV